MAAATWAAAAVGALLATAVCSRAGAQTIPKGDCSGWSERVGGWTTLKGCCGNRKGVALEPRGSGGGYYEKRDLDPFIGQTVDTNKKECEKLCKDDPRCTAAFMDHDTSFGDNEHCYRYELDTTGWVGETKAGSSNEGCRNDGDTCYVKKGCPSTWTTTTMAITVTTTVTCPPSTTQHCPDGQQEWAYVDPATSCRIRECLACSSGWYKTAKCEIGAKPNCKDTFACKLKGTKGACNRVNGGVFTPGDDAVKDRDDTKCKTPCPPTTIVDCPAGKQGGSIQDANGCSAFRCDTCTGGQFKSTVSSTDKCQAKTAVCQSGRYLVKGDDAVKIRDDATCPPCPPFKHKLGNDARPCQEHRKCAAGAKYVAPASPTTNGGSCMPCPTGTYTEQEPHRDAACKTCPPGQHAVVPAFGTLGAKGCAAAPAATFTAMTTTTTTTTATTTHATTTSAAAATTTAPPRASANGTATAAPAAARCPNSSAPVSLATFGLGLVCLCLEEASLTCADTSDPRSLRQCDMAALAAMPGEATASSCTTCGFIEFSGTTFQLWQAVGLPNVVQQLGYAANDTRINVEEGATRAGFFPRCKTCTCASPPGNTTGDLDSQFDLSLDDALSKLTTPASHAESDSDGDSGSSSFPAGAVAGIVVVVLLCGVGAVAALLWRRRNQQERTVGLVSGHACARPRAVPCARDRPSALPAHEPFSFFACPSARRAAQGRTRPPPPAAILPNPTITCARCVPRARFSSSSTPSGMRPSSSKQHARTARPRPQRRPAGDEAGAAGAHDLGQLPLLLTHTHTPPPPSVVPHLRGGGPGACQRGTAIC